VYLQDNVRYVMQSNTTLVGLFVKWCLYLYFRPHVFVYAYVIEPYSGFFQELTYTAVCLKITRSRIA
jgi:hypothetical protein